MYTPTQLIYRAAMKTQEVKTATEKIITYLPPKCESVEDNACWLCGGETGGRGQPTKKAIKKTFTDHPHARGQGSKSICPACTFCLSDMSLRNYSIVATEHELKHPSRPEIRELLLSPPEPPFVMCLAVSGQKWLHFKAEVSYNRDEFTVLLEEQRIIVKPGLLKECLDIVENLYIYFSKDEIITGRFSQNRIKECGIRNFMKLEEQLGIWQGTRILDLTIFIAQKHEKPEVVPGEKQAIVSRRETKNSKPVQLGLDWI